MGKFILRRLLGLIPQLAVILALVVGMVNLAPGSVIDSLMQDSGKLSVADRARLEHSLGLDKPLPVRYVEYASGALKGDLGVSITRKRPVIDMIRAKIMVTLELTLYAVLISITVGIPLGMAAAVHRGKPIDYGIRFFAVLFLGIPSFLVATMMVLGPALVFKWRPPLYVAWDEGIIAHMSSMILPVLAVSLVSLATNVRLTRSSFIDVMHQDYIRTARAKGLDSKHVWFVHGLRNALLPTVTIIGLQAAGLVSGAVVVEQVFSLPGLGNVLFDGLTSRDYPVIQGMVLVLGLVVVLLNLAVDIIYTTLDPRVKFS